MKILFLCGSLEHGRDGVGDYTRRLAGRLIFNGNQVGILALNDRFAINLNDEIQFSEGISIPTLRIPATCISNQRIQKASQWINEFDPDWISLQFVPFSFHPKGLPVGMGRILRSIAANKKWHIMFHELWVGMHKGASIKEVLWGLVQRQLIASLIRQLKPDRVDTQSSVYRVMLSRMGVESGLLPLFSNISVTHIHTDLMDTKDLLNDHSKISFVLFGGVHPGAPVKAFASEVKDFSTKTGIQVSLIILGRGGSQQKQWQQIWEQLNFEVIVAGEQSEVEISRILRHATFGITTTVYGKVEKSGSVAAMAEHGLQVICVAAPWEPRNFPSLEKVSGVTEYRNRTLEKFLKSAQEPSAFAEVDEVAAIISATFNS